MRQLILFSALLLAGCAQVKVVGPYKASLSPTDVESIVQIAQTIERGYYSRLILQAVAPDEVWVDAVVHGGTTFYDYSAVRRGDTWKHGRYTPPPID
jgi:hypothetical protein